MFDWLKKKKKTEPDDGRREMRAANRQMIDVAEQLIDKIKAHEQRVRQIPIRGPERRHAQA